MRLGIILVSLLFLAACAETGTTTTASPSGRPQGAEPRVTVAVPQPSAEVREAQENLRTLGLYDGAIDGLWGPETETAVRQFQQERGLEVRARLDGATQRAIRDRAVMAQSEPVTIAEPIEVRTLQNRLRQLGFFEGDADGVWGPTTQIALEDFQRSRGLPVGHVTEATLSAMGLDADAFPAQSASRAVDGDLLEPPVVRGIQQRLRELGFYSGGIDGIWGPQTQAALADFQRSRGLEATGLLHPTTASALGLDPNNLTASVAAPRR